MGSSPDVAAEQRAAWRLQVSVNLVLNGLVNGMVDTFISEDAIVMGDVNHAEMVLTEATPVLIAHHASVLEQIRAGLRDARVQRRRAAWEALAPSQETLAVLSGEEMPPLSSTARHPPDIRFRCVVAPEPFTPGLMDGPVVFIAGGIEQCPNFQATVTAALEHDHVVLLNPRRAEFDRNDPQCVEQQIQWEYDHRWHENLSYMLFWFPATTSPQPIAMLELGDALARPELPIVIGADPGFPRQRDVVLQCRAARPALTVRTVLDDVSTDLQNLLRWRPNLPRT